MIVVVLLSFAVIFHGIRVHAGYLKLPVLVAVLYLLWFLPQVAGLATDISVPASGYNRLILMMSVCLIAFWIGWYQKAKPVIPSPPPDFTKMVLPTLILTLISIAINLLLARYRNEWTGGQQWSGPITIVAFFAQVREVALVLSLLLFLNLKDRRSFMLLAANLAITVPVAIVLLRRSEMIGLLAALLCAYWFARRKTISPPILAACGVGLVIVVYVIGPLRGASLAIEASTGERPLLFDPDLWRNINIESAIAKNLEKAHDVRNALYVIDYTAENWAYNFGLALWNGFVRLYIPGQILGAEFKQSLYFEQARNTFDYIHLAYGFEFSVGTTSTGFGSAFSDFGYFGALYFFLMGYVLKLMFTYGCAGYFWSQVAYMCFLPKVLVSLTHGHDKFFVSIPFLAIVILSLRAASKYRYRLRAVPQRQRQIR
ncbi:hypothetical protein [Planktotalea sp.]|uniref:hypothetical protein n=1 Tax=Planktotalea sp. TaxID=2029877 RepID=UPI003D6B96E5